MNGDSYSRGRTFGSSFFRTCLTDQILGSRQTSSREHYSRDDRRDRDRGDRGGDRDRPRRRSRSPGHRGGRRDYEVDSYSSSRGYREREREDRYADRDRRPERGGEREWDRSGGGGHGGRRDRDDRPPRRDRELFDDRRGGGRRGGDREAHQKRERSASPPKKPKEPTPDLTDVVSVLTRRRRLTQWDIKPAGYEKITAEQAKLSGMFPLPGAPRQQAMDPSKLQAFMDQPADAANNSALKPSNARQAMRVFVSNLPANATNESVQEFFNLQMNGLNVVKGQDPCVQAQKSKDGTFALLEFKSSEDATLAFALDGIHMDDTSANGAANGHESGLQIRRPKDYIAPSKFDDGERNGPGTSSSVPDTQSKLCLTRIPVFIDDAQLQELVCAFGPLKNFVLVTDLSSGQSRGVAFFEYVDWEGATDMAISNLNGMELGDSALKVIRSCVGMEQVGAEMSVSAMSLLAGTESKEMERSRVLCLLNMVTAEELIDTEEYEGKNHCSLAV